MKQPINSLYPVWVILTIVLVLRSVFADTSTKPAKPQSFHFLSNEAALLSRWDELEDIAAYEGITKQQLAELNQIRKDLNNLYDQIAVRVLYERLLYICSGNFDGGVQVAASRYLALCPGDEVVPFLKQGLKIELPGGVSTNCAKALSERCRGPEMEKVVAMLDAREKSDRDYAFEVLNHLQFVRHRSQFEQLKSIYSKMKPGESKELVGAFLLGLRNTELKND